MSLISPLEASWCAQLATICCISWRSGLTLRHSVCWNWANVWANTSSIFIKHSEGSHRIMASLLVAFLTFSVPSLNNSTGLSILKLSQDVFVYHLSLVTTCVAGWYNLALWSPNPSRMQSGSSNSSGVQESWNKRQKTRPAPSLCSLLYLYLLPHRTLVSLIF